MARRMKTKGRGSRRKVAGRRGMGAVRKGRRRTGKGRGETSVREVPVEETRTPELEEVRRPEPGGEGLV